MTSHHEAEPGRPPIFTRDFNLTWFVSFFGYASFYFMLSTIPLYVKAVGGTELEVGLVVAMFSAVSLCVRMPMGKACDVKGARPFMMAGAALLVLSGFVYSRCHSVSALFGARALHGVSWAFFGTSVYAQVAEIIPAARRGEAMGYYGISCNLAMALGPALGFALIDGSDFGAVFALSCGMAALACLFAAPLRGRCPGESARAENSSSGQKKTGGREEAGNASAGPAEEKHSMFEKSALAPAIVMGLVCIDYSAAISFLPLHAKASGVQNPGFFFTVYAVSLVAARTFTGRLSDLYGRAAVIVPGIGCICLSLMVTAPMAVSTPWIAAAGALFGFGFSTAQSSIMALIADRAPAGHRGSAMGTYMTVMDLGIGCGALLCGALANAFGFRTMFIIAGAVSLGAAALFVIEDRHWRAAAGRHRQDAPVSALR